MIDFKPGQVVRLKSGGPRMTVKEILPDGRVVCQWEDKIVKRAIFAAHTLELAPTGGN